MKDEKIREEAEVLSEEKERRMRLAEMDSRLLSLQERRSRIQEGVLSAWMALEDLEVLSDYMQNEFIDDYEADAASDNQDGENRPVYTSGLLSQDALYDEIQEYYFLAKDMKSAAKEILLAIGARPEEDADLSEDALLSESISPDDPDDPDSIV